MAEPFLGEVRLMSFSFAPKGWAQCNGQILPINQNQALFALLGTTFGGNGQTTFALPNLQGRTPIHAGNGHPLGQVGGEFAHTLTIGELPNHAHAAPARTTAASAESAVGATLAVATKQTYASTSQQPVALGLTTSSAGGSQPHANLQPYLVINFCIALQGIFPSQN